MSDNLSSCDQRKNAYLVTRFQKPIYRTGTPIDIKYFNFFMRQFQLIHQVSHSGAIGYLDIKGSPWCCIAEITGQGGKKFYMDLHRHLRACSKLIFFRLIKNAQM